MCVTYNYPQYQTTDTPTPPLHHHHHHTHLPLHHHHQTHLPVHHQLPPVASAGLLGQQAKTRKTPPGKKKSKNLIKVRNDVKDHFLKIMQNLLKLVVLSLVSCMSCFELHWVACVAFFMHVSNNP